MFSAVVAACTGIAGSTNPAVTNKEHIVSQDLNLSIISVSYGGYLPAALFLFTAFLGAGFIRREFSHGVHFSGFKTQKT
ncbi:MAG: hypothetical protein GF350_04605 [Chitinivibrionales bacterium]|nr:hypothetical protein [Chitinivibrionales bacterium]